MLLPLADALAREGKRRPNLEKDLERWFWMTTFAQSYAQGVNTQAVSDALALRAWRIDPNAVPQIVQSFQFDESSLQDQRRRNEMLVTGIACLLIKRNARDWIQDKVIRSGAQKIDFHHIYPRTYLRNLGILEPDLVANLTILYTSTNHSLRNDDPTAVARRTDIKQSAVETHAVAWDQFTASKWNEFVEDRSAKLTKLIHEVTI
jgi:hypothetical protein